MYFFALDGNNGINLGSVASYHFNEDKDGDTITLKMYDRSEKQLKGEQVERFRRALQHFTLGLTSQGEF